MKYTFYFLLFISCYSISLCGWNDEFNNLDKWIFASIDLPSASLVESHNDLYPIIGHNFLQLQNRTYSTFTPRVYAIPAKPTEIKFNVAVDAIHTQECASIWLDCDCSTCTEDDFIFKISFDSSGDILYFEDASTSSSIVSVYTPDTWYSFTIELDWISSIFNITINDQSIIAPFATSKECIKANNFYIINEDSLCKSFFDNLYMDDEISDGCKRIAKEDPYDLMETIIAFGSILFFTFLILILTACCQSKHEVTMYENKHISADLKKVYKEEDALDKTVGDDMLHEMPYHIKYSGKSTIFGFSLKNNFRRAAINMTDTPLFDHFILLIIFLNCTLMAIEATLKDDASSQWKMIFRYSESFFLAIFTMEMFIRILATGFVSNGPGSYLRDGWNIIDFLVVLSGYSIFIGLKNMSALRTFRVLRPLRALTHVRGLRVLITAILRAIPQMFNVLFLIFFVFLLFGIVGLQLFGGILRRRCFDPLEKENGPIDDTFCTDIGFGRRCPAPYECLDHNVPVEIGLGFDNILRAFLAIFQCITLEGWSDIMYAVSDASGSGWWSSIYFVFLVIFGGLFTVNLFTAVMFIKTQQTRKEENKRFVLEKSKDRLEDEALKAASWDYNNAHPKIDFYRYDTADSLPMYKPTEALQRQPTMLFRLAERSLESAGDYLTHICGLGPFCRSITEHDFFEPFIIILIIINTVLLASQHYQQPEMWTDVLELFNYIFTAFFILELILKLFAEGIRGYFSSEFNCFDFFVILCAITEISLGFFLGFNIIGLTVLRAFRIFRIFKIIRGWRQLHLLIRNIIWSLKHLFYMFLIIILVLFIFALLGMQLFADKMYEEDGVTVSRANFNTFTWSLVTTFQLFSGENWNEVSATAMRNTDNWLASLYFVAFMIIGNFMLFNLFIAILLTHLRDLSIEDDPSIVKERGKPMDRLETEFPRASRVSHTRLVKMLLQEGFSDNVLYAFERVQVTVGNFFHMTIKEMKQLGITDNNELKFLVSFRDACRHGDSRALILFREKFSLSKNHAKPTIQRAESLQVLNKVVKRVKKGKLNQQELVPLIVEEKFQREKMAHTFLNKIKQYSNVVNFTKELREEDCDKYASLWIFHLNNPIRRLCKAIVKNPWFENLILVTIIISTVFLGMEETNTRDTSSIYFILNIFFTCCWIAEAVLKIIAYGFIQSPTAYIRSTWNQLDFFVLIFSVLDFFVYGFHILKVFRTLRALRPMRLIAKTESIKVVFMALYAALPVVVHVFLISMMVFVIYAIIGVQFYAGMLLRCEDETGRVLSLDKDICIEAGFFWRNPPYHFDNTLYGVLTLFSISSLEMWPNLLYSMVDITSEDKTPIRDNSQLNAAFVITFVVISNVIIFNLFVTVVCDTFHRMKEKLRGSAFLSREQHMWLELQKLILFAKGDPQHRRPPDSRKFKQKIFDFVTHNNFDVFIITIVLFNALVMALWTYKQSEIYTSVLYYLNLGCTGVFIIEAILKLIGLGIRPYFASKWNRFDFILILGSIISIVIKFTGISILIDPTLLRLFRVLRIVRLLNKAKSLRSLIRTFVFSIPSFLNVGAILTLTITVYAILGMALFSDLPYGKYITRYANFDSFPVSLLTLVRSMTGENWNGLMYEAMPNFKAIECTAKNCGTYLAVPYFVTFMLFVSYVLLNLFVALVLENYEDEQSKEDSDDQPISCEDLDRFQVAWAQYIPHVDWWKFWRRNAGNFIPWRKLRYVLDNVPPPLGWLGREKMKNWQKREMVKRLDLPLHHVYSNKGYLHCIHLSETLIALSHQTFSKLKVDLPPDAPVTEIAIDAFREKLNKDVNETESYTLRHAMAMDVIETFVRSIHFKNVLKKRVAMRKAGQLPPRDSMASRASKTKQK